MKTLFTALLLLASAATAVAQDSPKFEIFGGYSLMRAERRFVSNQNVNGWNSDVTGYVTPYFGLVGDFSGYYTSVPGACFPGSCRGGRLTQREYMFMAGPRLKAHWGRAEPFAQAVFGFNRSAGDFALFSGIAEHETSFAMSVGGGFDVRFAQHFAMRPAKVEYNMVDQHGFKANNVKFSTGFVYKF